MKAYCKAAQSLKDADDDVVRLLGGTPSGQDETTVDRSPFAAWQLANPDATEGSYFHGQGDQVQEKQLLILLAAVAGKPLTHYPSMEEVHLQAVAEEAAEMRCPLFYMEPLDLERMFHWLL